STSFSGQRPAQGDHQGALPTRRDLRRALAHLAARASKLRIARLAASQRSALARRIMIFESSIARPLLLAIILASQAEFFSTTALAEESRNEDAVAGEF